MTQLDFARKVGVSPPQINRIVKQRKNPSAALIVRIEKVTNGEVSIKDLFVEENSTKLKRGIQI